MKKSLLVASLALATAFAAPAFAQTAPQGQGLTRAQVRAELAQARKDGSLAKVNKLYAHH